MIPSLSSRLSLMKGRTLVIAAFSGAAIIGHTGTALADFSQTGAGPYLYTDGANWDSGTINGVFSKTLATNQIARFNSNYTFLTGLSFNFGGNFNLSLTSQNAAAQSVTGDFALKTITLASHGYSNGDLVTFASGTPPTGLSLNTTYYVIGASTNTFQLAAAPGGAAINFTTNGSSLTLTRAYQATLGGDLTVNPGATGRTVTFGSTAAVSQLGVAMGSSTRTMNVATASTLTFTNSFSGTGTVVKTGSGSLVFSHTLSSFGGSLDIRAGTASVHPLLLGGGNGSFALGSTDADDASTSMLTISTVGSVSSSNTLLVRSTNVANATRTLNAGNGNGFTFNGNIQIGDGNGSISHLRVLGGGGSGPVLNGIISNGAGSIGNLSLNTGSDVKIGGAGSNTYTGTTTIEKGSLILAKTGGAIAVAGDLHIGSATENASVRFDNANQTSASTVVYFKSGADFTAKYNINVSGGNQQMAGLVSSGAGGAFVQSAGTTGTSNLLTLSGTGNYDFSGTIRDTETTTANKIAVKKNGSGTQTFRGLNTYSGTTEVTNGTLILSGTHSGAGAYTISGSGTLAGEGLLSTNNANVSIESGAVLAPGGELSTGTLSMALGSGKLSLGEGSHYQFTLGSMSDQLDLLSGKLDIGSGLIDLTNFTFTAGSGFSSTTYVLFQTTSAIEGILGENTVGVISGYDVTLLIQGNDLVLQVVPEPSTVFFGGCGALLLAFAGINRRRKSKIGG